MHLLGQVTHKSELFTTKTRSTTATAAAGSSPPRDSGSSIYNVQKTLGSYLTSSFLSLRKAKLILLVGKFAVFLDPRIFSIVRTSYMAGPLFFAVAAVVDAAEIVYLCAAAPADRNKFGERGKGR